MTLDIDGFAWVFLNTYVYHPRSRHIHDLTAAHLMHLVFPGIPGNIGHIFSVGRDSGRSDSDRCSASDAEPESHKKQKIGQILVKQRCVVFLFFSRGCGCFSGVVITDQYGRSNTKNNIWRLSSSFNVSWYFFVVMTRNSHIVGYWDAEIYKFQH